MRLVPQDPLRLLPLVPLLPPQELQVVVQGLLQVAFQEPRVAFQGKREVKVAPRGVMLVLQRSRSWSCLRRGDWAVPQRPER